MGGKQGGPPAGAHAVEANHEVKAGSDAGENDGGHEPADAEFESFAAFDAGTADVEGEGGPVRFGSGGLAGGGVGTEIAVRPILLIEAEGAGVAADDAFVEDATGKLAEAFLFQRQEVVPADFGDRGNLFQRDAAGNPLHAQFFTKASHRISHPGKRHPLRI